MQFAEFPESKRKLLPVRSLLVSRNKTIRTSSGAATHTAYSWRKAAVEDSSKWPASRLSLHGEMMLCNGGWAIH